MWVARGVGVNWCCVLKGVNKAGEHPRSNCKMHMPTHTHAHSHTHAGVRQLLFVKTDISKCVDLDDRFFSVCYHHYYHFISEESNTNQCGVKWFYSIKHAKRACLTGYHSYRPTSCLNFWFYKTALTAVVSAHTGFPAQQDYLQMKWFRVDNLAKKAACSQPVWSSDVFSFPMGLVLTATLYSQISVSVLSELWPKLEKYNPRWDKSGWSFKAFLSLYPLTHHVVLCIVHFLTGSHRGAIFAFWVGSNS